MAAEEKRPALLLIATAAGLLALLFLFLAFDSPKYQQVAATYAPASETQAPVRAAPPAEPVNINTADLEQLQTLHGVGAAKAQAILDYRAQNGRFRSIEELAQVSGISSAVIEENRERITLS